MFRGPKEEAKWLAHVKNVKFSMAAFGQRDPIIVIIDSSPERVHKGISRMVAASELGWTWLRAEVRDYRPTNSN